MERSVGESRVTPVGSLPGSGLRFGRRVLGRAAAILCVGALLSADRPVARPSRPLPIAVDDDSARYLHALTDIPTLDWSLLAVTAAVLDPGNNAARGLFGQLPAGNVRGAALGWTYRAESRRMRDLLAQAAQVYRRVLPPDRARHYSDLLATERARLAAGGQADYPGIYHLAIRVNREQGLMARAELDDLLLVRQHRIAPTVQPRGVATLLRERDERRLLASTFRQEAARLLAGAAQRIVATPTGPLTLLGDLGATPGGGARTYQLIRGRLRDLSAASLAAEAVYFTAGEYLALEPATPPDRWADLLPAEQRAYATANFLSPRLAPQAILDPAHASRVLWATLPECHTLVAELRTIASNLHHSAEASY